VGHAERPVPFAVMIRFHTQAQLYRAMDYSDRRSRESARDNDLDGVDFAEHRMSLLWAEQDRRDAAKADRDRRKQDRIRAAAETFYAEAEGRQ